MLNFSVELNLWNKFQIPDKYRYSYLLYVFRIQSILIIFSLYMVLFFLYVFTFGNNGDGSEVLKVDIMEMGVKMDFHRHIVC